MHYEQNILTLKHKVFINEQHFSVNVNPNSASTYHKQFIQSLVKHILN